MWQLDVGQELPVRLVGAQVQLVQHRLEERGEDVGLLRVEAQRDLGDYLQRHLAEVGGDLNQGGAASQRDSRGVAAGQGRASWTQRYDGGILARGGCRGVLRERGTRAALLKVSAAR